jgi:hypothetical protein
MIGRQHLRFGGEVEQAEKMALDQRNRAVWGDSNMSSSDTGELLLVVSEDGATATSVPVVTLADAGLLERQHLQEWVIANPSILGSAIKVVTVEYDGWAVGGDPQRDRLDVLGIDTDGRLVVVELKRGVVSDTVEMQAVKYAAMTSQFDLKTLGAVHAAYLQKRGTALTDDQALESLQAHATGLTDETLANPRVAIVAQGFRPVVVSSVMWLATHGVEISLIRFQPYRQPGGQILVSFSRLFPLPDLRRLTVGPRMPLSEPSTEILPAVEWSTPDLLNLGRVANATTRTTLDLCAERPGSDVSLTEVVSAAGISRSAARGQLAGLTMIVKRRFSRRNWPFVFKWAADGSQQAFYTMDADVATRWLDAAKQLDMEQSSPSLPSDELASGVPDSSTVTEVI